MKCPYCGEKLNEKGLSYLYFDYFDTLQSQYSEIDNDYLPNEDLVEYEKIGFFCKNCKGFITTKPDKAREILNDNSDVIYNVNYEETRKLADKIIEELEKQNLSFEVFEKIADSLGFHYDPD